MPDNASGPSSATALVQWVWARLRTGPSARVVIPRPIAAHLAQSILGHPCMPRSIQEEGARGPEQQAEFGEEPPGGSPSRGKRDEPHPAHGETGRYCKRGRSEATQPTCVDEIAVGRKVRTNPEHPRIPSARCESLADVRFLLELGKERVFGGMLGRGRRNYRELAPGVDGKASGLGHADRCRLGYPAGACRQVREVVDVEAPSRRRLNRSGQGSPCGPDIEQNGGDQCGVESCE